MHRTNTRPPSSLTTHLRPQRRLIPALAATLIISYGSLYYAFAVLARPIQTELGWSADVTVGAYSAALLIAGLSAYWVGNVIDKRGGRRMMTAGSVIAGTLLVALSHVSSPILFYVIWAGLGVAMALTQYEAAFAVTVATYPDAYRSRIGLLTLAGGLASTTFWPLTHFLVEHIGWRDTALVLAGLHFVVSTPLYWYTVPRAASGDHQAAATAPELPSHLSAGLRRVLRRPVFWLTAFCFTAFGFAINAMVLHVIPILESRGITPVAAVSLAALVGPMQVSARFADVLLHRRLPALVLGGMTVLLIPLGIAMLLPSAGAVALLYAFVILYGAGLGLITLTRATTTAEFFGRHRYGAVSGLLMAPSAVARALGPFVAAAVLTTYHDYTLVLALIVGTAAAGAVCYWLAVLMHKRGR